MSGASYTDGIGYGVSIDGCGALLLGYSMGCTRLLTIAPQTVISDAKLLRARWNEAIAQWPSGLAPPGGPTMPPSRTPWIQAAASRNDFRSWKDRTVQ